VRELAPDSEAWAVADDEGAFRASYIRQLEELGLDTIFDRLAKISQETGELPLVLLCYEPTGEFCHRHVLSAWLRERGVEISELQPGDLAPPARAEPEGTATALLVPPGGPTLHHYRRAPEPS
jgi:hypothetical protein